MADPYEYSGSDDDATREPALVTAIKKAYTNNELIKVIEYFATDAAKADEALQKAIRFLFKHRPISDESAAAAERAVATRQQNQRILRERQASRSRFKRRTDAEKRKHIKYLEERIKSLENQLLLLASEESHDDSVDYDDGHGGGNGSGARRGGVAGSKSEQLQSTAVRDTPRHSLGADPKGRQMQKLKAELKKLQTELKTSQGPGYGQKQVFIASGVRKQSLTSQWPGTT